MAHDLPQMLAMSAAPTTPSSATPPQPLGPRPLGFHGAVSEFKRRLIEATLTQSGGNRTRAARALGLQRTYLLRLMREFEVRIPPPPGPWRRAPEANGGGNGAGGAHAGNGDPLAPTQRH
jgi:DNA-binding NtrC family response regulator